MQRIVIKIGTSSLTHKDGTIDVNKIKEIVRQVAELKKEHSIVIVSSGSVATGFRKLGFSVKPKSIASKQASAAVGQALLMEEYNKEFEQYDIVTAQILLTRGDFVDKRRYTNAFSAIEELLHHGAIPIINENDSISIEEVKLGDNDTLSAQVASMIHADLLVILTDIDGLYTADPRKDANAKHIDRVTEITEETLGIAGDAPAGNSTGGMHSKITAAALATMSGVPVFICSSRTPDAIIKSVDQSVSGTYFEAEKSNLKTRQQWMAFYSEVKGTIIVDDGAKNALENGGKSLLPSGILATKGKFHEGDMVEVVGTDREVIGRGISKYDYKEISEIIGTKNQKVVIHRNDWIGKDKMMLIHKQKED